MPFVKNGAFVTPGQPLCAIEEFIPGKGTYEDENGIVRAAVTGTVRIDMINYQIEVRGENVEDKLPTQRDIVIGYILSMRDELATIKITKNYSAALKSEIFTGALHISQASPKGFMSSLYEGYRPGDIVKLKIVSGPPYVLSAKGNRLGVILAHCTVCGAPLYLNNKGKLVCKNCGHEESRVLSTEYILREKQ